MLSIWARWAHTSRFDGYAKMGGYRIVSIPSSSFYGI